MLYLMTYHLGKFLIAPQTDNLTCFSLGFGNQPPPRKIGQPRKALGIITNCSLYHQSWSSQQVALGCFLTTRKTMNPSCLPTWDPATWHMLKLQKGRQHDLIPPETKLDAALAQPLPPNIFNKEGRLWGSGHHSLGNGCWQIRSSMDCDQPLYEKHKISGLSPWHPINRWLKTKTLETWTNGTIVPALLSWFVFSCVTRWHGDTFTVSADLIAMHGLLRGAIQIRIQHDTEWDYDHIESHTNNHTE